MTYLDANVFIFPIIYDVSMKEASVSKDILLKISEGTLEAATSSLTWDEVTWIVRKTLGTEYAEKEGKKFLEFPNLKILTVNEEIIKEAQRIMKSHQLKPRDSIHAACAIKNNIKEIISDDPDFDKVSELKRIKLEKANELT